MSNKFSPTRRNFPLSSRSILKRTIQATLLLIIILLVMYFFGISLFDLDFNQSSLVAGGAILLVLIIGFFYEKAYYSTYFYELTENYIIIKKDPIRPREITVPYERISSVTVDRDLFDLILGLCDLHINTESASFLGMEAHIDGLSREAANGLQAVLEAKMAVIKDPPSRL